MTYPDNHDDHTIWARPTGPGEAPAPPTVAVGPEPALAAGVYPPPTLAAGAYPPPTFGAYPPPVAPPPRRNRRVALIAGLAALVVAAIVTTVVILVSGPSVGDVAGTWTQRQSLVGMGFDQTLVVGGDRFTYTLGITAGGEDTSGIIGGLLGPLLGTGGGMTAGVRCAGKVEVDGDRFVFASDTGPCGTIYGTLHGKTLTLTSTGSQPSQVDLVRE